MSTRPSALLFDLGGVLLDWNPAYLYDHLIRDPETRAYFLSHVCSMAWHGENDRGRPMAQNIASLSAKHPDMAEWIEAWDTGWPDMFRGMVPDMEGVIEALAGAGHDLFGLSNLPAEKYPWVRAAYPCLGHFRDIIVSGQEGVIKPQRRIFDVVCERSGLNPHDFLFVDDLKVNVDAAREFGFEVHWFQNAPRLKDCLKKWGFDIV